jgi:hypothetical protein
MNGDVDPKWTSEKYSGNITIGISGELVGFPSIIDPHVFNFESNGTLDASVDITYFLYCPSGAESVKLDMSEFSGIDCWAVAITYMMRSQTGNQDWGRNNLLSADPSLQNTLGKDTLKPEKMKDLARRLGMVGEAVYDLSFEKIIEMLQNYGPFLIVSLGSFDPDMREPKEELMEYVYGVRKDHDKRTVLSAFLGVREEKSHSDFVSQVNYPKARNLDERLFHFPARTRKDDFLEIRAKGQGTINCGGTLDLQVTVQRRTTPVFQDQSVQSSVPFCFEFNCSKGKGEAKMILENLPDFHGTVEIVGG